MHALMAVVETGSVSIAANRLGVTKSVVSKRISDIERKVQVELFRRLPRKMHVTDVGRRLYDRIRQELTELALATDEARGGSSRIQGQLRIAAPISFGVRYLGAVLAPVLKRHPNLEVAIDLDDRSVDLLGNGYDLGMRVGVSATPSLIQRRLAMVELWVCASPEYLNEQGTPHSLEDLSHHRCVGYAHLAGGQVWNFQGKRTQQSVRVPTRWVVNNGELMRLAAEQGLGLVMLPDFLVAESVKEGKLKRVLPKANVVPVPLTVLFPKDRQKNPAVRLLVETLVAAFAKPSWR